jgi:xanthine dehydrogenase accessory factor
MIPRTRVLVRGGGEMASAAARLLFSCGFPVIVLEAPNPLAVRRLVSFAEAVREGSATVEGVTGRLVEKEEVAAALAAGGFVPVVVDPEAACRRLLAPEVLVDARMAKCRTETERSQASLVIGLGPGFVAGADVHAVIETQRGRDLGRVIWSGPAEADSSVPAPVLGFTTERVLRAPRAGIFRGDFRIGDVVGAGARVGAVGGEPVEAGIGGLVRGLIADGVHVEAGVKVGDIDPRGSSEDAARLSDKGRAVAAGVLEAVLVGLRGRL